MRSERKCRNLFIDTSSIANEANIEKMLNKMSINHRHWLLQLAVNSAASSVMFVLSEAARIPLGLASWLVINILISAHDIFA